MSALNRAVLAAFAAGLLVGAAAGVSYQRSRRHRGLDAERALRRLSARLDLDAAQQDAVRGVLEKRRDKALALHEETKARMAELRRAARAEIEPVLRPEQKEKYKKLQERWDSRRVR